MRMQSLLAAEFGRRDWEWDLTTGRGIIEEVERRGMVEPDRLARQAAADFVARNRTDRAELAAAIESALGGLSPATAAYAAPTTVVVHGSQYNVSFGAKAKISGSRIKVGDTHINVESHSSKQEVIAAVALLVRGGLADDWNADAAIALADAIEKRDDIAFGDVQQVTGEVVGEEKPKQGRAKAFLEKVVAAGLGGALGNGISAGVGESLSKLPI